MIPPAMRLRVYERDQGCVGFRLIPGVECALGVTLDHVRASGALGVKSVTCDCNLVSLCVGHHEYKTLNGRAVRPLLLAYLDKFGYGEHPHDVVVA